MEVEAEPLKHLKHEPELACCTPKVHIGCLCLARLQVWWQPSLWKRSEGQERARSDLLDLDFGPHPAQSLQSVCPGAAPLAARLPWNKGEFFGKVAKSTRRLWATPSPRPPRASKRRQRLSDAALIKHLGS